MENNENNLMTPKELNQLTSDILLDIKELKQRINSLEALFKQHSNSSNSKNK